MNQFLGELDWTYAYIDQLFKMSDEKGNQIDTQYKRHAKEKNPDLILNHMVLNNIPKKHFMERKSAAFGIHINPAFHGTEIEILGTNVTPISYDGNIMKLNVANDENPKSQL